MTEIASYAYEVITTYRGMVLDNVGSGSKYLGAYIHSDGNWLEGIHTYEVAIPKDAVANQFWSITVYENDTRCIIKNDQEKSGISSVMDGSKVEADGSVKVYVGPAPLDGYENNWVLSDDGILNNTVICMSSIKV